MIKLNTIKIYEYFYLLHGIGIKGYELTPTFSTFLLKSSKCKVCSEITSSCYIFISYCDYR